MWNFPRKNSFSLNGPTLWGFTQSARIIKKRFAYEVPQRHQQTSWWRAHVSKCIQQANQTTSATLSISYSYIQLKTIRKDLLRYKAKQHQKLLKSLVLQDCTTKKKWQRNCQILQRMTQYIFFETTKSKWIDHIAGGIIRQKVDGTCCPG